MSDKITPHHQARKAILYIRQSSAHQVHHNLESQRLQYAMQDRLQQLGWREIEVVDDDLGRSAAGLVTRAGFARMVAEVCLGQVGAVAAREVSRFARNSREWQQLVEVCRVVDTVLIDLDTVYSPRHSNDRLLLGLKGQLERIRAGPVAAALGGSPAREGAARRTPRRRGRSGISRPMRRILRKIPIAASRRRSRWCFGSLRNWGPCARRCGGFWSTGCNCPSGRCRARSRGAARPTACCIASSVVRCTAARTPTVEANGRSTTITVNRTPSLDANRVRNGWC